MHDRECGQTQPVDCRQADVARSLGSEVPVCGREMIKRQGGSASSSAARLPVKNDKGEPSCTFINLDKDGNPAAAEARAIKTTVACEKCGSPMLLRNSKRGPSSAQSFRSCGRRR
jgi:ssDNA-binding Zn-finger/Zn-ribbon topoisomerase 1